MHWVNLICVDSLGISHRLAPVAGRRWPLLHQGATDPLHISDGVSSTSITVRHVPLSTIAYTAWQPIPRPNPNLSRAPQSFDMPSRVRRCSGGRYYITTLTFDYCDPYKAEPFRFSNNISQHECYHFVSGNYFGGPTQKPFGLGTVSQMHGALPQCNLLGRSSDSMQRKSGERNDFAL